MMNFWQKIFGRNKLSDQEMAKQNIDKVFKNSVNKQVAEAANDFRVARDEMVKRNTRHADKYYHCTANCRAARRGPAGKKTAKVLSYIREVQGTLKGEKSFEKSADQTANFYGREIAAETGNCENLCKIYEPIWSKDEYK